jgi:tetratricopeptide (TPR) repeat protein
MLSVLFKVFKNQGVSLSSSYCLAQSRSHEVDARFLILEAVLTVSILLLSYQAIAIEGVTMDLRVVEGNFHIEFLGRQDWDYELERKEADGHTTLELRVPSLSLASPEQVTKVPQNEVVESIFLERVPGGSKDILSINLKSNLVESFDYLTEKPSRLVIDLYLTKKALAKATAKIETTSDKSKNTSLPPKAESRKPAMDELTKVEAVEPNMESPVDHSGTAGIFDGGDPNFERFAIRDHEIKEEAIVRSQENLYILFPMLIHEGQHFEQIKSQPPVYEIIPQNNPENKMARLVLTLFEKNRLAVGLKTSSWFLEKYPKSEYEEIVRFVIGDIYFKLWAKDGSRANYESSMQAYREALQKYPSSLLAMRAQFLVGYSAYSNKDFFGSLRMFQGAMAQSKPSELKDKAHLAVARSLMRLNQFDEALKSYEQLEKEGFAEKNRVEATFLKGDIHYMNHQFQKASAIYREAALKYPQFMGQFPNAFYNLAESLFWQKLYKASLESYREFLTRFPGHAHAPYAMTRAGETLEILGAEPRRVMGAFLETYFRYGGTDGAAVARMRLLSNRMRQMKVKESNKAIEEINKIASTIILPQIDLFASIMISEGLSQRGEFEGSINTLLSWYQTNSTTRDASLIRRRVVRHVNEKMEDDVENGNFLGALKLHNQYGELWLKGSGRIDTVYNLARAFEQAGAYKESDFLFRETVNLLSATKDSAKAREHSVFEHLPTLDQAFLRIARVKMELGNTSMAYDYLKEIKEPTKLTEPQQIERMEIAINLLKEKGDTDTAKIYLRDLIENWKGQPLQVVGVRTKLAELELSTNAFDKAEMLLKTNISDLEDGKKVPSQIHLQSQKLLSDTLSRSGKSKENRQVIAQMFERYQDFEPLDSYRFRLGKLYFDEGNIQKATEVWNVFEQKKETFWRGMAKSLLKDHEWKDTYQKYIKRIPAMAKSNEKGQN